MRPEFEKIYVAIIPLKLRKLILPFFTSDLYLLIRNIEAYKLLIKKKNEIKNYFKNSNLTYIDQDYLNAFKFIEKHGWTMYPGEYSLKYKKMDIEVYRDYDCGLLYVMHVGKRLYFKRSMKRKEECEQLYINLLIESDIESPHCYIDSEFFLKENSIVLDIGSAEGIFVLSNIEKIKHAYLFEYDPEWTEALQHTFKKWNSKITIINKYVSNQDSDTEISIDFFVSKNNVQPDFIKMDIEGAEHKALTGAKKTIYSADELCLTVCTYHRHHDSDEFSLFFDKLNYQTNFTKGVLLILNEDFSSDLQPPYFRKGVIRGFR